jgi:acyl carrier protein
MDAAEILGRVVEVLSNSFDLDPGQIRPSSHLFEDLDLDSIDAIDLVVGLEEETGLAVSEEELKAIRLVQDVVDLVQRKLGA